MNDKTPPDVAGGPVTVHVNQNSGGANWIFPGPRKLDPTVFGTAKDPKGTEVPGMILGVPEGLRKTLPDGSQVTSGPTPFGDKFASTSGSVKMTAVDATATDGATTKDQIDFTAEFQAPNNEGEYKVVVKKPAPHGWFIPTAGGVITNFIQHGVTGWGTRLMPTEYDYVAFWGLGDISKDGTVVASNRLVHVMLTEYVRKAPYDLVFDSGVNPNAKMLHLIVPPFTPFGDQSPVPTGFKLPNGQMQPFLHVMFSNLTVSVDRPAFTGQVPKSVLAPPTPLEGLPEPPPNGVYKQSPWWPYLQAHMNDKTPPDVAGGPVVFQGTQDSGGANWIFPGPRKLDPAVFGTADHPKGTEQPAMILGVPEKARKTLSDGSQETAGPTPFGDKFASTSGTVKMTLIDATATDGATTKDRIDFEATFGAPNNQGDYKVVVTHPAAHGWFIPTAGGVITNIIQHGVTGWGTRLMPTEYDYAAFWGLGDLYHNGKLVARNRLVHVMETEFVRKAPYDLVFDGDVNPNAKMLHLIMPPFTPFGDPSPVPTGFKLPNGQEQPFLHVMFNNVQLQAGRMTGGEGQSASAAAASPQQSSGASAEAQAAQEVDVTAQAYKFTPSVINLKVGQPVKFVAHSVDMFHTFSVKESKDATQDIFSLDLFANKPAVSHVFTPTQPGQLYLYCKPHEGLGMTGTINVSS